MIQEKMETDSNITETCATILHRTS